MKVVRLIKLCLNEICRKVLCVQVNVFDSLPVQNDAKEEIVYCHCFLTFL